MVSPSRSRVGVSINGHVAESMAQAQGDLDCLKGPACRAVPEVLRDKGFVSHGVNDHACLQGLR